MQARGRSIDMVRSETARIRREKNDASGSTPSPESDEGLIATEVAAQLQEALAALPRNEREPIELAYYRGMTYTEVANHLKLPEGTVKSRIRTGLRKMRLDHKIGSND
jgi:RNA polymerase sigma-70 factor (ECF subfamily)